MHKAHLMSAVAALLLAAAVDVPVRAQDVFWLGADISGTSEIEARGGRLYNAKGEIRENTALMSELGLNAVRLRVWVNPEGGFCGPDDVLQMAKRARYYGMAVMVDFHYSDWWADPGKQPTPGAWQYYSVDELKTALANHTRHTLRMLRDADIDVRWVQVGNETTHGFLWPKAKAEDDMEAYAGLTQAGYDAVKAVFPDAQVIVHLDGGCDPARYDFIFDGLRQHGAKWDVIGVSVYPYWDHEAGLTKTDDETIERFTANIVRMAEKYGTDAIVVETGVLAAKPKEGKALMSKIIKASRDKTGGHCHGVFYWAPELEGAYPLGAFKDGRPTEIMEAFTEAARER